MISSMFCTKPCTISRASPRRCSAAAASALCPHTAITCARAYFSEKLNCYRQR